MEADKADAYPTQEELDAFYQQIIREEKEKEEMERIKEEGV